MSIAAQFEAKIAANHAEGIELASRAATSESFQWRDAPADESGDLVYAPECFAVLTFIDGSSLSYRA